MFLEVGALGVKLVTQNGSHLLMMFYPTPIYELERVSHRTESTKDSVASIAIFEPNRIQAKPEVKLFVLRTIKQTNTLFRRVLPPNEYNLEGKEDPIFRPEPSQGKKTTKQTFVPVQVIMWALLSPSREKRKTKA